MNKVIIFGGSGLVGSRFLELKKDDFEILAPLSNEIDILNLDQIKEYLNENQSETVINFAAYTAVEKAEEEKGSKDGICYRLNAIGAKNLALACKEFNNHLIHLSTEYVFDGTKENSPYIEEDIPNPINWYGATKYFGEQFILESDVKSTIVRISMPYSPIYQLKKDVVRFFLDSLKSGNKIVAVDGQRITPTITSDIVEGLSLILERRVKGIYHLSSTDSVTPLELAKTIAETFSLPYFNIAGVDFEEFNRNKKAKLLKYSWLNPAKFEKEFGEGILHSVEESLQLLKNQI